MSPGHPVVLDPLLVLSTSRAAFCCAGVSLSPTATSTVRIGRGVCASSALSASAFAAFVSCMRDWRDVARASRNSRCVLISSADLCCGFPIWEIRLGL